ncbi:MAG TPA: hypothetical protein DIC60_00915 [Lachnospiraceae bacterium]|nr:hypothetical protein [Lachnospiraceae bacterium]
MNFLKILKLIKLNHKLISFYVLVFSTFVIAFVSTGKNINVYSQPLPVASVRYDTSKTYVPSKVAYDSLNQLNEEMGERASQVEPIKNEVETETVNEVQTKATSVDTTIPVGMPLNGQITSPFGDTIGRTAPHSGVDIGASIGTPIRCTGSGKVISARYSKTYGYIIEIDHGNGYQTLYAHNSKLTADEGEYVAQGDIIALSGNTGDSTGPHLHYQMSYCGKVIDPLSN